MAGVSENETSPLKFFNETQEKREHCNALMCTAAGQPLHFCSGTKELRCAGILLIICLLINTPGNTFPLITPYMTAVASSLRTPWYRALVLILSY